MVSIMVILMGFVMTGIQHVYREAHKTVAASVVNALSNGLDNFHQDEGFYPGANMGPDENAIPELFSSLLGEKPPNGRGGRSAPYLQVKKKDIAVFDEVTGEYRTPTFAERWDSAVPKYVVDPWGEAYWYRVNQGRDKAEWVRNRRADIWSTGPDVLSTLAFKGRGTEWGQGQPNKNPRRLPVTGQTEPAEI